MLVYAYIPAPDRAPGRRQIAAKGRGRHFRGCVRGSTAIVAVGSVFMTCPERIIRSRIATITDVRTQAAGRICIDLAIVCREDSEKLQTDEETIMNIVSWTPFREMDDMLNRYRSSFLGSDDAVTRGISMDWRPVADISETGQEYLIKAELPEVERKDVHVSVENGRITISGERKMDKEEEDATQHRIESFYGTFSRSFALPPDVDQKNISAKSENGVLKVHLPKTKVTTPKPTEIPIK